MRHLKELLGAFGAIIGLTLTLGLVYPLVMTGVSQVVFPNKADGSKVTVNGKVVGSKLIGRAWTLHNAPDPKYFQPRPSATGYSPSATYFSNRGPNSAAAVHFYKAGLQAYLDLEGKYDPGLTTAQVPNDAVETSASGVDPHISPANARIQAHRIAAVRHLGLDRVDRLISDHTDGRFLGLYGDPGVNVLELNLALDQESR